MTQPTQSGQYNDQTQPASNYGQQYPYQGYQQPSTEYQYQGYQQQTPTYPPQNYYQPQYQPPTAPPPQKGFPGWVFGLVGLAVVAIVAVVVVVIMVTSNKTTKTDPITATSPATTAAATPTINSATTTVASGSTSGAATTIAVTTKPATTAAVTTKPVTTAAVTTKPATTTSVAVPAPVLDEGWTNFKPANSGFSIALPAEWQSVDQDSVQSFLSDGLKQIQENNPQFSSSLGEQVKVVFASGAIKFFGFDTTSSSDFTINLSVGKQVVPASTTLASYVQLNVSQIENAVKLTNPVVQKKVTLAGGEAVQLKYQWTITIPSTGEPTDITTTQYMFVRNGNAYIVTFTCLGDQIDEKLPLFEQIMETFRVG